MIFRGGKVLNSLYFGWIWFPTFDGENCTVVAYFWQTYTTLFAVKYQTILAHCLHELDKVVIVFPWRPSAIYRCHHVLLLG